MLLSSGIVWFGGTPVCSTSRLFASLCDRVHACRHKHPSSLRPRLFDCADASLLMFTPAVKPSFLAGVLFLVFDSVLLSF